MSRGLRNPDAENAAEKTSADYRTRGCRATLDHHRLGPESRSGPRALVLSSSRLGGLVRA